MSRIVRNRLLYAAVLLLIFVLTWLNGGRMMYVALYAMILLPALSCVLTFAMLRGLRVTQTADSDTVVKDERSNYTVTIHNRTPLMYDNIICQFMDDHFAVETDSALMQSLFARPFARETHTISFCVKYRGVYQMGLRALRVNDLMGLFNLKRHLRDTITLTVLPRMLEMSYFPLAMNLLSQAHSNFEMKEEDYAAVSDIRKYEPADSIKRVHWKLTAKRGEWLVKVFQSNALTRITVIMDNTRRSANYEEALPVEDRMVETALAVAHYALRRTMPVELVVGDGIAKEGRSLGDFEGIYHMAAKLSFDGAPDQDRGLSLLDKRLNDSASYINVVILTSSLSAALYERIAAANHGGHFIAALYFPMPKADPVSEEFFNMLLDTDASCYRVTEGTNLLEVA